MELINKTVDYTLSFKHKELEVLRGGLLLLLKDLENHQSDYLVKTGLVEDLIENLDYCLKMEV